MSGESRRSASEPTRAAAPATFVASNDVASLGEVRRRVQEHLQSIDVDDRALHDVDLALEELAGNVIRHGYRRADAGEIRVEVSLLPARIRISISDDARAFDPTAHPEPAPLRSVGDAPIGGRGISMVRKIAHAMRYTRAGRSNCVEVELVRDRGKTGSE